MENELNTDSDDMIPESPPNSDEVKIIKRESNRIKKRKRRRAKNIAVRTLFVSGLPIDTKPREIYLLFLGFTGFQGSILKLRKKEGQELSPVAFVTFEKREQAETTKSELQGMRFDPELPTTIKLEFAKSNTKSTQPRLKKPNFIGQCDSTGINYLQTATVPSVDMATSVFKTHEQIWHHPFPPYADNNAHHMMPFPPHIPPNFTMVPMVPPMILPAQLPPPTAPLPPMVDMTQVPTSTTEPSNSTNQCTTLFVANIGTKTAEEELKQLFTRIPSFRRLKVLRNKDTTPVAFVEYLDHISAVQAKNLFHGQHIFPSSEKGGIRIEFAKSRMVEDG